MAREKYGFRQYVSDLKTVSNRRRDMGIIGFARFYGRDLESLKRDAQLDRDSRRDLNPADGAFKIHHSDNVRVRGVPLSVIRGFKV